MIQFEESYIKKAILHKLISTNQDVVLSDDIIHFQNEDEERILKNILLKPFANVSSTFEFTHAVNLDFNVLYSLSKSLVENNNFVDISKDITQLLSASSKHANIKNGDLFIAQFEKLKFDQVLYSGLGIYKFEEKENFIETLGNGHQSTIVFKKGIGSKKPEKACLILFTEEPYTILVIDNNSQETDYWQHEFIKLVSKNDHVNSTNYIMNLTKNYITEQMNDDFEVSKADQIDLLNRSVQYFKSHEAFDKPEFEKEVFHDPNVIESFRKYDETYKEQHQVAFDDSFQISTQAVKKQAKIFKSVLKLDKNFHIYIHGDKELIEQGRDADGRKYYKIYYEEEN